MKFGAIKNILDKWTENCNDCCYFEQDCNSKCPTYVAKRIKQEIFNLLNNEDVEKDCKFLDIQGLYKRLGIEIEAPLITQLTSVQEEQLEGILSMLGYYKRWEHDNQYCYFTRGFVYCGKTKSEALIGILEVLLDSHSLSAALEEKLFYIVSYI